jgi:LysM repeat protein
MKILKIFGVVVGIHVFALILIFANPGCSSPNKSTPPSDTTARNGDPSPTVSLPSSTGSQVSPVSVASADPVSSPPSSFDPNAPAATIRFTPTRPGTPAASALEAQPVADVTPASTYAVAKGDSLWTIAKKHHVSVGDLAAANNLKASSTVRMGQRLIIPGGKLPAATVNASVAAADRPTHAAVADAPVTPRGSGESVKHVVRPGETLGAIARKYQVKVGEIATANNISDPAKIRPGMELIIPGWQAPSGKAKSGAARGTETAQPATPSIVTPAPDQDLDAGLKSKSDEAPVIKVEEKL